MAEFIQKKGIATMFSKIKCLIIKKNEASEMMIKKDDSMVTEKLSISLIPFNLLSK